MLLRLDVVLYSQYLSQSQLEGRPRFEKTLGHLPKVLFVVRKNILIEKKGSPGPPPKEGGIITLFFNGILSLRNEYTFKGNLY